MASHRLKRGLDLPLAGDPQQVIEPAQPCTRVGVLGDDHVGLKPTFLVQPGDRVERGQLLFEDKTNPGVRYTAPAAGIVSAIHRGDKRAFQSLVIDVDGDDARRRAAAVLELHRPAPQRLSADEVRALLVESGLWTALRTRPFSRVPAPATSPRALFITAMDTRPHAPSVDAVLAGRMADFQAGVACLAKLTQRHDLRLRRAGLRRAPCPPAGASRSRSSTGRTRPATPARTSISSARSTSSARSGTSATRTSPRSDGCSPPAGSTSNAWSRSPALACGNRACCARAWARRPTR